MKVYEYMASGRPIISSDLPVIYESLGREHAVFCPPEDVEAWAAAIQGLLDSPEKAARYAKAAQDHVKAFSWTERAERALEGWA
jgi:glycosyltransferase involved in cell wall biosynthesis